MIALLIHFLGNLLVDSAIPPSIGSADAYFLAWWYAAFAAVDLIAICFACNRLRIILAISFAWSSALAIEQLTFHDLLQRNDWLMQVLIDGLLFTYLLFILARRCLSRKAENTNK